MEELPKPISKQDKFLHNIADGTPTIDDIEAISRQDKYLKYIALNGGTSEGNINQKLGTWSPTLVNYTDSAHPNVVVDPTYSVVYSNAYYLKMGKLVYISFRIKVEITDIGTGYACVAGLPFNPDQNMIGQSFCISENSAVTESDGVVYDGVVGQLYPDIYLETYNERHIPAISLRTDNGIQAKKFKVGTNWISYSGCYVCDDDYVPPEEPLVTVEHGGTGATTVSEARTNLEVYSKTETDNLLDSKANTDDLSAVATSGSYNDLSDKPTIPTKISDLTNDSEFITNSVNNLVNYYTKSDTYTQTEIDNLVSAIPKFTIAVVAELPTQDISTTTIYLVPSNSESEDLYKEYIYVNNQWELIGIQKADLTNYYNKSQVDDLLSNKADTDEIITDYNDLENKPTSLTDFGGVLPINQGGTGASTSENARTNLDVYSKSEVDNLISPELEIVQNTGTSETAVMSQKAVSEMNAIGEGAVAYNASKKVNNIAFGGNASAGAGTGSDSSNTAIGYNAIGTGGSATAVGCSAKANKNQSTSIGTASSATSIYCTSLGTMCNSTANYSTSIGSNATVSGIYSVTLGYYSRTTEASVVSVGDGSTNANYGTRRIVNVKDPVNAQDAATKKYVDDKVAESSGSNINVVQETGQSETDVMSQKAVTDAIPTSLTDFSDVLSIEQGGTGATTAGNARANLEVYSKSEIDTLLEPTVLYSNSEGTQSSITLSDSAENYSYLEIYFRGNDSERNMCKVFQPNGAIAMLSTSLINNVTLYQKTSCVQISGTSISWIDVSHGWAIITSGQSPNINSSVNKIYIMYVIGYK